MSGMSHAHATASTPRHEAWPAEKFYWSIVECPGRVVPLSGTLLLLMEDDLPIESEQLHAVGVRLDDRRVLACAASREELSTLDPSIVTLTPASIPQGVPGGDSVDPGLLNLLIDDFEPFPLRRERRTRAQVLFCTLVLLTLVAALGLWRRAAAWNNAARAMDTHAQQLLTSTIAPAPQGLSSAASESLLDSELLRLRQTRWGSGSTSGNTPAADATEALAGYLSFWPHDPHDPHHAKVRTDFLSVTPTSIALSLRMVRGEGANESESSPSEPTAFIAKLPRPRGWIMDEPRLTARDGNASLAIQLRREGTSGAGGVP